MDYIPTGGTRESQMSVENAVCSFLVFVAIVLALC
jgi:hypothetical protein